MNMLAAIGVLLNSALYLSACFAAGIYTGNAWAWRASIVAMGVTYLCYDVQVMAAQSLRPRLYIAAATALVVLSVILGAAAGLLLL